MLSMKINVRRLLGYMMSYCVVSSVLCAAVNVHIWASEKHLDTFLESL